MPALNALLRRVLALVAAATVATAALLVTTSGPAVAVGVVRAVATTGNDANAGTVDAPFRTITRGLRALGPGDTLLVRGGTYVERVRNPSIVAGRSDARVTVAAYPGERPVVSGLFWLSGASHWSVSGINVTWSSANLPSEHMVKFTDGTGWEFRDAEVWGARSYAAILVAGNPSGFRLAGLHVHDTVPTNGTNQDHLIYLNSGVSGGVVERNLLVGSPNGRAVKIGPGSSSGGPVENVVVRYNTMVDNLGPSNVQLAWGSSRNHIHHNVMVRSAGGRNAVTAYDLTGTGNVVGSNLVWQVAGPFDRVAGLVDGGGNVSVDPMFDGAYRPQNNLAAAYGHAGVTEGTDPAPAPIPSAPAPAPSPSSPEPAPAPTPPPPAPVPATGGYRMVGSDGGIFAFGDAPFLGSTGGMRLNKPIVGMAATPAGAGYWLVASDGGIFAFGDAPFLGSTGAMRLNKPIVGMAATPAGGGYWLVASDGGIFAFGNAAFHGSTGAMRLNKPIVGMAPTADGGGYWLVASDGGIFAFGNAAFHGSAAGRSAGRIVGMVSTPDGGGYWLAGADGGVHAFGSAPFAGSAAGRTSDGIAGIARTPDGGGYWLAGSDGAVYTFGSAPFLGSMGGTRLNHPVVGVAGLR